MPSDRSILHVDMDAFFASVEQRDDPALRGKPVLVGGSGRRGVIAAASYEARVFGCRSAQPTAVARRLCPSAIIVKPRGRRYREVSREVFDCFQAVTPLVEPLSVDEAFLDVTGSRRLLGTPETIARDLKHEIRRQTQLTASIGVAPNKFLAKLASDLDKPDGLTIVPASQIEDFLAPLAISRMWGVGQATEARLNGLGIRTFGDLQSWPAETLTQHFGGFGDRLARLCRGRDLRPVVRSRDARSVSHEQTFGVDLADPQQVRDVLLRHVERVGERLRSHRLLARTVSLKIRFGDFETITRAATLDEPANRTDVLWRAALELFDRWTETNFQPVRLIGFATSHFTTAAGGQIELFTQNADQRLRKIDEVSDQIRSKFGDGAIHRGGA